MATGKFRLENEDAAVIETARLNVQDQLKDGYNNLYHIRDQVALVENVPWSSGVGGSPMFIATNGLKQLITKQQSDDFLGAGLYEKTPEQLQIEAKSNSDIKNKLLALGLSFGAAMQGARLQLDVIKDIDSNSTLTDSIKGQQTTLQISRLANKMFLYGFGEGNKFLAEAKKIGLDIENPSSLGDEHARKISTRLGNMALLSEGKGMLNLLSEEPTKYTNVIQAIKADPVFVAPKFEYGVDSRTYPIAPETGKPNIPLQLFETPYTMNNKILQNATDAAFLFDTVVQGAPVISGIIGFLLDATGIYDVHDKTVATSMRRALMNESMSTYSGVAGNSFMHGALGMAASIGEILLLSRLTKGKGAGAATTNLSSKAAQLTRSAKITKAIFSKNKLITSAYMTAKNIAQEQTNSGVGFSTRFSVTGENKDKAIAGAAWTGATMLGSMAFSELLVTKLGTSKLVGNMAKGFQDKDYLKIVRNMGVYNLAHNFGDVGVDLGIDLLSHNAIELISGVSDPFPTSQEVMTSAFGEAKTTPGGIARQLMFRATARIGSNAMSKIGVKYGVDDNGKKLPVFGNSAYRKALRQELGFKPTQGKEVFLNRFYSSITDIGNHLFSSSIRNVDAYMRGAAPMKGQFYLLDALGKTANPAEQYAYLWKFQEATTNDLFSMLTTNKSKKEVMDNILAFTKVSSGNLGMPNLSAFLGNIQNFTGREINDDAESEAVIKHLVNYIYEGSGDDVATDTNSMFNRMARVMAFAGQHIIVNPKTGEKITKDAFGKNLLAHFGNRGMELAKTVSKGKAEYNKNYTDLLAKYDEALNSKSIQTADNDINKVLDYLSSKDSDPLLGRTLRIKMDDNMGAILKGLKAELDFDADQTKTYLAKEYDAITKKIADLDAMQNKDELDIKERNRLQSALEKLDSYKSYTEINPTEGVRRVSEFLRDRITESKDMTEFIEGKNSITGSALTDLIAAAGATSKMYHGALMEILGRAEDGADTLKNMSNAEVQDVYESIINPMFSVIHAFGNRLNSTEVKLWLDDAKRFTSAIASHHRKDRGAFDKNMAMVIEGIEHETQARNALSTTLKLMAKYNDTISLYSGLQYGTRTGMNHFTKFLIAAETNDYSGLKIVDQDMPDGDYGQEMYYRGFVDNVNALHNNEYGPVERTRALKASLAIIAAQTASRIYLDQFNKAGRSTSETAIEDARQKALTGTEKFLTKFLGKYNPDQVPVKVTDINPANGSITVKFSIPDTDNSVSMLATQIMMTSMQNSKSRLYIRKALAKMNSGNGVFFKNNGKQYNINQLHADLVKRSPKIADIIRVFVMQSVLATSDNSKIDFDNLGTIHSQVHELLLQHAGKIMSEYNSENQAVIVNKLIRQIMMEGARSLKVDVIDGHTKISLVNKSHAAVINGKDFSLVYTPEGLDEADHKLLAADGYMPLLSFSAANDIAYVKIPDFEKMTDEEKTKYVVTGIEDFVQEQIDRYSVESDGETYRDNESWFAHVKTGLEEYKTRGYKLNDNSAPSITFKSRLSDIVKIMGKAWNDSAFVLQKDTGDEQYHKVIILDPETLDKNGSPVPKEYEGNEIAWKLYDAISISARHEVVSSVNFLKNLLNKLGYTASPLKTKADNEARIGALAQDTVDESKNKLTEIVEEFSAKLNELSTGKDEDTQNKYKATHSDLIKSINDIDTTNPQKITDAILKIEAELKKLNDELSMQLSNRAALVESSLLRFGISNMTELQKQKLVRDWINNDINPKLDEDKKVDVDEVLRIMGQSDIRSMLKDINDVTQRPVNQDNISRFIHDDPKQMVGNIIGLLYTKGFGFQMKDPAELQKRMGAFGVGGDNDNAEINVFKEDFISEIQSTIKERLSEQGVDNAEVDPKKIKFQFQIVKGEEGVLEAPIELWLALERRFGRTQSSITKIVHDMGGGVMKVQGEASGDDELIRQNDDGTWTVTFKTSIDNIKLMSGSELKMLTDNGRFHSEVFGDDGKLKEGGLTVDLEGIKLTRFLKGLNQHADALQKFKAGKPSRQDIVNYIVAYAYRATDKAIYDGAYIDSEQFIKDAVYGAARRTDLDGADNRLTSTVLAFDDAKVKTGLLLNNSFDKAFRITYQNLTHNEPAGPTGNTRVPITMLAQLALEDINKTSDEATQQEIRRIVGEINKAEKTKRNLDNTKLISYGKQLMDFLSQGEATYITKESVGVQTNDGGLRQDVYFIGLSRSPSPGAASFGFRPIHSIGNIREGGQIRVNRALISMMNGDFDGDMALGFGRINRKEIAMAIAQTEGNTGPQKVQEILDDLGTYLIKSEANSVHAKEISTWLGSPVTATDVAPRSIFVHDLDSFNKSKWWSTVIKRMPDYEDLNAILMYGNPTGALIIPKNLAKNLDETLAKEFTSTTTLTSEDGKLGRHAVYNFTGSVPQGQRLFLFGGAAVSGREFKLSSMFGGNAIGSVELIAVKEIKNFGGKNSVAAFMYKTSSVINGKDMPVYSIVLAEQTPDMIPKRVIGWYSESDFNVLTNGDRVYSKLSEISRATKENLFSSTGQFYETKERLYIQTTEGIFRSIDSSFVTPKPHIQWLIKKIYGEDQQKFVDDFDEFIAGALAASIVPIRLTARPDTDVIEVTSNRLEVDVEKESPMMKARIHNNLMGTVLSTLTDEMKEKISLMVKATKYAEDPDTNGDLVDIKNTRDRLAMMMTTIMPPSHKKFVSAERYQYDGILSYRLKNTPGDSDVWGIRNTVYNMSKLNHWADIEKITLALDKLFGEMGVFVDPAMLTHLKDNLGRTFLALDPGETGTRGPIERQDLIHKIQIKLQTDYGVPKSADEVDAIITKLGIGVSKKKEVSYYTSTYDPVSRTFPFKTMSEGRTKITGEHQFLTVNGKEATAFDIKRKLNQFAQYNLDNRTSKAELATLGYVYKVLSSLLNDDSRIKMEWAYSGIGEEELNFIIKALNDGTITKGQEWTIDYSKIVEFTRPKYEHGDNIGKEIPKELAADVPVITSQELRNIAKFKKALADIEYDPNALPSAQRVRAIEQC